MRSLQEINAIELAEFNWETMTNQLIFKTFFQHKDRDFLLTPANLLENGVIVEKYSLDASFDCPLYTTPIKRNLFRLYTTIARVAGAVQLGIPENPLSKLRALEEGHTHLVNQYFGRGNREVASALNSIYSVMYKEVIELPASSSNPEDTVII